MRASRILVIVLLIAAGCSSAVATTDEDKMFRWINEERAAVGLPAYELSADLQASSQVWSQRMSEDEAISHDDSFFGSARPRTAKAVGENVGVSGSVENVHDRLMASAPHRANILHTRFTHVGIGVMSANGDVYVTQRFAQFGSAAPATEPSTTQVPSSPPSSPTTTVRPTTTRPCT